jgi:hypothetical protein
MNTVNILLQGEGIADIQVIELEHGKRGHDFLLIASQYREGAFDGEFLLFEEDVEEPLNLQRELPRDETGKPSRLHVHRCRSLMVEVGFNGEVKSHRFSPSATIQKVKRWAAIEGFRLTEVDAAEHVLQISGSNSQPDIDTHIGLLATGSCCEIEFNLVPLKRVEG